MNRPFGVPALAGPDRLKAGLQTSGVPTDRFKIPMHSKNDHPDPFTKGERNLRWHRVRVTNRDPRQVRFGSPLPARSGERIKVRGASD